MKGAGQRRKRGGRKEVREEGKERREREGEKREERKGMKGQKRGRGKGEKGEETRALPDVVSGCVRVCGCVNTSKFPSFLSPCQNIKDVNRPPFPTVILLLAE